MIDLNDVFFGYSDANTVQISPERCEDFASGGVCVSV